MMSDILRWFGIRGGKLTDRYLIFGGERYYASGGGYDILDSFSTLEGAILEAGNLLGKRAVYEYWDWFDDAEWDDNDGCELEWCHVVDLETMKVVFKAGEEPFGVQRKAIDIKTPPASQ